MSKESAAAYRIMMQNPAWQDLLVQIDEIKAESVRDEDSIPTQDLTVALIAEGRGIRKGLDLFLKRIEENAND